MTNKSLPTLIFIPGAWHRPSCYEPTIKLLESLPQPYKCVPIALPSVGCKPGSPSRESWQPDIDTVRDAIDDEVKDGSNVLVIAHSAGALPANEALKGVDLGMVKQMIIAGFMVDSGNSVLSFSGGTHPAVWDIRKGSTRKASISDDIVYPGDPIPLFYHVVPEKEQQHWVDELSWMPFVSKISPTTHAAWKEVSTAYVVCEDDRACLPEWQVAMLANAEKEGVHIDTYRINTSHSPFLSQPAKLAEIIRRVAGEEI